MANNVTRKKVKNNGKFIGYLNINKRNARRITTIAGFVLVSALSFSVGRASKQTEVNPIVLNTLNENYFDEPVYNGIEYTIKPGDTISGIVYSYESDDNKAIRIIREIEDFNNINANSIRDGMTISLFGVPASHLEDFGYTDNYNYFEPKVEVDLRLQFLSLVEDTLDLEDPEYIDFLREEQSIINAYNDYKANYLPGDEAMLDDIIDRLRTLCYEAEKYGYSFENNLRAMPLSEATRYNENNRSF